jgi:hypothetical protein
MPLFIINIVLAVIILYLLFNRKELLKYNVNAVLVIVAIDFIAEVTVYCINRTGFKHGSSWVYNFTLPAEAVFYGTLFKRVFKNRLIRLMISIASFGILIPFLFHYLQGGAFFVFVSSVYSYLSLFILFCVLWFFVQLFINDYFQINPLKLFYFWFASGLLVCYLGGFMLLTNAYKLFYTNKLLYNDLKILNLILNIFLYTCLIVAVECLKKFKASQIQSL